MAQIGIIMGSKSDFPVMKEAIEILKSINFSNKEILAQYLKDNIIKFCE